MNKQNSKWFVNFNKFHPVKRFYAIIMLILFVTPIVTKSSHFIFSKHEHHHGHIATKSEKPHFTHHHKQCPFFQIDFVEFIENQSINIDKSIACERVMLEPKTQSKIFTSEKQSFQLRAPPVG